jgi:alpha-glucosidase (family GH31 glycosyl hydrolase)
MIRRSLYLPRGRWTCWHTGEHHEGGRVIKVDAPLEHLPVFVRPGAVIPTVPVAAHTGLTAGVPWELNVFPGAARTTRLITDDGLAHEVHVGDGDDPRVVIPESLAVEKVVVHNL